MATQTPTKLATTVLTDTIADLYENTGSDPVVFTSLLLINKSSNTEVKAYLFVDRGGGDVLIAAPTLNLQYTSDSYAFRITLENGHKIRGYADDADSINCIADGVVISA